MYYVVICSLYQPWGFPPASLGGGASPPPPPQAPQILGSRKPHGTSASNTTILQCLVLIQYRSTVIDNDNSYCFASITVIANNNDQNLGGGKSIYFAYLHKTSGGGGRACPSVLYTPPARVNN